SGRTALMLEFWAYFSENRGAVVGLCVFVFICFVAIFADFLAPYQPSVQFRESLLLPPAWLEGGTWRFVLGTDPIGRDILSRLIYGSRYSLFVGCVVVT